MPHVLQLVAAQTPPPDDVVGPGVGGFLVIFALAIATLLLIRSMVGHLRKVRYGPGPDAGEPEPEAREPEPGAGEPERPGSAPGSDGAGRTGETR
jgi:hypothetical protein